jgi:hypothetical protein
MTRMVVLAGTSTETERASSIGESGERSRAAALTATAPEGTSLASVSRLITPLVRPPEALVSPATACTRTDVDDS